MEYIELIGGLILLVISGDFLVKGGSDIAKRFKISSLVVGMTVVAFGTSAPELIVSLRAALSGSPEIALGNVIGSNIANIGLILGLTALIFPMAVNRTSIIVDWPVMMAASLLFFLAATDHQIGRAEGLAGFLTLLLFVVWSVRKSRKAEFEQEQKEEKTAPLWLSVLFIAGSSAGLAFGAKLLVSGASDIALAFGVSERVIGVTIVAFGTSVPELVASVIAAFKKEADISIGNIIGSNLFNILCVIGLTATIQPIPVDFTIFRTDLLWMMLFALLLFVFMMPWKKEVERRFNRNNAGGRPAYFSGGVLGRYSGIVFLLLYIYYIYGLF